MLILIHIAAFDVFQLFGEKYGRAEVDWKPHACPTGQDAIEKEVEKL